MPFVNCAACGSETLILFGAHDPGRCRSCAAPLAGEMADEEPWVVRIQHPGFDVVKVGGPLDAAAAAAVAAELSACGERGAILDLSHCSFIDAAGVELLVRSAVAAGGDPSFFSVIGARGPVAQMIDFSEGGRAVPRYPSVEAMVADIEAATTTML
jgi:anti-anti-sigma factor